MKQKRILIAALVLLILLIVGLICGVVGLGAHASAILDQQQAVYQQYLELERQMQSVTLTICEGDQVVRRYALGDLGLQNQATQAIYGIYSPMDRMLPEEFAKLPYQEILQWSKQAHPGKTTIRMNPQGFQPELVWYDLMLEHREPSVDAQVVFTGSQYLVEPEAYGTELDPNQVMQALMALPETMYFSDDSHASVTLDVAPFYMVPQVTQEHNDFDFEARLQEDLKDLSITIDFDGSLYAVEPVELLYVQEDGFVAVKEDAVDALVESLVGQYTSYGHPYYFDSEMQGRIPISWLKVDHAVKGGKLKAELLDALTSLESRSITASYSWQRYGREFSLGDTYIAVDIDYQNMVFYKNGRRILSTDIVTGDPAHGGTPRGLWSIVEFDRDCWLVGSTYREHVDYWIGVHGNYGIHDAVWRDAFGGNIYLYDGSHGCVNTPYDAIALLYESANLGTPVLFF